MVLPSLPSAIPTAPMQAGAGVAAMVFILLVLILVAAIVGFVFVAIWMYGDCRQRGESAALWLTLYLALGILTGFIAAVIVLIVYLLTRSKDVKFDRQGNPLVPTPPSTMPYAPQASEQWQPPPPATPYIAPAPVPAPPVVPGYAPTSTGSPYAPAQLSRVRCPRCRNVFEYQKQPVGPTHVKCPSCGEEGNI